MWELPMATVVYTSWVVLFVTLQLQRFVQAYFYGLGEAHTGDRSTSLWSRRVSSGMPRIPDQGVFASPSAVAAQGKEDLMRLTYSTTTGSSYGWLRPMEKEQYSENFQEIFDIGQRRTKYMGVQLRQAPLLDRSSCIYSTDFARKPLGDHVENGKMAAIFKSGSAAIRNKFPTPSSKSTYAEEVCLPLTTEERLAARLPPAAARSATIGANGARSVYTTSLAHETYQAHPEIGMSLRYTGGNLFAANLRGIMGDDVFSPSEISTLVMIVAMLSGCLWQCERQNVRAMLSRIGQAVFLDAAIDGEAFQLHLHKARMSLSHFLALSLSLISALSLMTTKPEA
ncbi:hypothetical protein AK812_SmicGene22280 [Symbiodinium microadriaticum]|uniref:Uncharacterized protein n=1 Tax=Symbiodinium microadriaticum TaxID=2951 RepID=A0A1Q9DK92_SYMMI|nr:hypothetical protein AK812_SmicGene22280 [Symbiodinium microadriaticum]